MTLVALVAALGLACIAATAPRAEANANVAALQVALKALHHYHGRVDGINGPGTKRAVRRFQRAHHLPADGVAGPRTRRALGRRGRPSLGSRIMMRGQRGWDVAGLQYMLRRRGIRPGRIDGGYGLKTEAAVRRFQAGRGLAVDGRAGATTIRELKHRRRSHSSSGVSGPVRFLRPINAPMGDGFGIRPGGRMHTGIDFPAPWGSAVRASGRGVVSFAGWNSGGYGYLIIVRHRLGFETWYAHLSRILVSPGRRVVGGTHIGNVGSTGRSTGPHLHWEVRHNGVPINPLPRLLNRVARVQAGHEPEHDLECGGEDQPGAGDEQGGGSDPATARLAAC